MSEVVRKATERRVTSYNELARELGVSREALLSWRTERREPRWGNLARMVDLLVDTSAELRLLAAELREEATIRRRRGT